MQIHIEQQSGLIELSPDQIEALAREVLSQENVNTDQLSIYFVSTETISALHEQFFNDPTPTDCITLPIDSPQESKNGNTPHILGEIFVCPSTAEEYIQKNGGKLEEELSLYIVHALLHLVGYDDIDQEDQKMMREAEKKHLQHLKKNSLLLALI